MSIAEAFEGVVATRPAPADVPAEAVADGCPAVEVDEAAAVPVPAWIGRAVAAASADLRQAWLWDACGPSPRALWDARIPDRKSVPGDSRALWIAWIAYNHAVLALLVPLMVVFWVVSHPARLAYTAPVVVPLAALWLT